MTYFEQLFKIIKLLEDSNILTDGITETVQPETKKQEGGFFPALLTTLAASLVQLVIFSVAKGKNGSGVKREGKVYMDKKF